MSSRPTIMRFSRACPARHLPQLRRNSIQPLHPQAHLQPLTSLLPTAYPGIDELDGAIVLCLDREKAKNALSVQMVAEMRESIAKVEASRSSRLLLVHSLVPGTFCAGADLRERKTMSQSQVSLFLDSLRGLMDELDGVKVPTIAVIDGWAMGGGLELALSADLRVGGPGLKAALPETKLGIIPGAGGTQRLARLVGVGKAKELVFTGKRVEPAEAEKLGLVNVLAQTRDTALDAAVLLARQILTSAPLALTAAKRAISASPTLPLADGLDLERKLYNPLLTSSDRDEGLLAFAEKRRAVFRGE